MYLLQSSLPKKSLAYPGSTVRRLLTFPFRFHCFPNILNVNIDLVSFLDVEWFGFVETLHNFGEGRRCIIGGLIVHAMETDKKNYVKENPKGRKYVPGYRNGFLPAPMFILCMGTMKSSETNK